MVVVNQAELADLTLRPVPLGGATPLETTKPTRFRVETIDAQYAIELPSRTHQVVQTINERKLDVKVYPAAELNASIEGLEQESQSGEGSLAHSFLIDTNHPDIQQLAKELLQGENIASSDPAIRRVSAFCKGISSRLESTPFDRRVSAGHTTLASGKGDSFDMAALLAAICRSDGIPARIAIGLRCEPKVQPLVMGLHAWTEIHDGQRWLPFDASSSTHMEGAIAADRIKWVDTYWNGINPYESILQLARHLSMLEVSVSRGTK
jgi:transglutaminase-like putative cysteine protease